MEKYKKEFISIIITLESYGAVIYKCPALIREQLQSQGVANPENPGPAQLDVAKTATKQAIWVETFVCGSDNSQFKHLKGDFATTVCWEPIPIQA